MIEMKSVDLIPFHSLRKPDRVVLDIDTLLASHTNFQGVERSKTSDDSDGGRFAHYFKKR